MADLFPSIDDATVADFETLDPTAEILEEELITVAPIPLGFSWKFDFNKGDVFTDERGEFTFIQDTDVLRDWVGHTLNTERYESPIYGGDIGTEIPSLIGARNAIDGQTHAEIQANIMEALAVHDRIEQVYFLGALSLGHDVFISFQYTTDDSLTVQEVVNL